MLENLTDLVKQFESKAKRIPGTLKDEVEKFRWWEGDSMWAAFIATIDVPAVQMLAHFFYLDTHEGMNAHNETQGDEPREITQNINGSRSAHYRVGFRLPAHNSRIFEIWQTWKEQKLPDGRTQYVMGLKPINDFQGGKEVRECGSDKERSLDTRHCD